MTTAPVPSASPVETVLAEALLRLWLANSESRVVDSPEGHCRALAEAGAAALAAAGLLADTGGETVTEWGVRWDDVEGVARTVGQVESFGTRPGGDYGLFTEDDARYIAGTRQTVVSRERTRTPDRVTEWTEVKD